MRKAEIIELIRNGPHGPGSTQRTHNQQSWAPDIPPRPTQTQLVRFRPDRPRQPPRTATTRWGEASGVQPPGGALPAPAGLLNKKWIYLNNKK